MFADEKSEKNLKDLDGNLGIVIKDTFPSISYTKTDKLITALYMVTDIVDKDEPLRNKLRTLGVDIISDIHAIPSRACLRISEIMSFLDIASAINVVSEMNCNILRKEFVELDQSIKATLGNAKNPHQQIDLSEFLKEEPRPLFHSKFISSHVPRNDSKGHTNIGVQKGSTLMGALKKVGVSNRPHGLSDRNFPDINMLREARRKEIKDSIRTNGGQGTIKDIKDKARGSLVNCGQKTLQRELVYMVKEGVLNRTGEKRWSRYSLKI